MKKKKKSSVIHSVYKKNTQKMKQMPFQLANFPPFPNPRNRHQHVKVESEILTSMKKKNSD